MKFVDMTRANLLALERCLNELSELEPPSVRIWLPDKQR